MKEVSPRMQKADRLFAIGLEKLSDELRHDVLTGRKKVTKRRIMTIGLDDSLKPKSILEL